MRRHLLLVIVGIVAGALLLAGAGTYLLAGRGVRRNDAADVLRQARQVAVEVPLLLRVKDRTVRREVLDVLRLTDGMRFAVVNPAGRLRGSLPQALTATSQAAGQLVSGDAVSGTSGPNAFAAVPIPSVSATQVPSLGRSGLLVVVLVQRLPSAGLGLAYLLLVSGATLAVAVLAAAFLSRRITRPVVDAVDTTRRIAEGDLAARVPEEVGAFPELASLTASINSMAASLARSRTLQRQFLLSVSHDLRTPLTSVLGYAEAIADGTIADPRRAGAIVVAESRRLERLVGDLLELARLDSRQFSLHAAEVDVGEVVRDTAEGFRPAAQEAGLQLTVVTQAPGAVRAWLDRDRLSQVVANLVENAYKFATARVQVWVGTIGPAAVVLVDDDGPGHPTGRAGACLRPALSGVTSGRPAGGVRPWAGDRGRAGAGDERHRRGALSCDRDGRDQDRGSVPVHWRRAARGRRRLGGGHTGRRPAASSALAAWAAPRPCRAGVGVRSVPAGPPEAESERQRRRGPPGRPPRTPTARGSG